MKELLRKMRGRFWTREEEMIDDIETETDFDVLDISYSYITVIDTTLDDDETYDIEIIRANTTITIR